MTNYLSIHVHEYGKELFTLGCCPPVFDFLATYKCIFRTVA